MEIEKINWEVSEPADFPCFVCEENRAEFKARLQHRGVTTSICLCSVCKNLPETVLIERIFGGIK